MLDQVRVSSDKPVVKYREVIPGMIHIGLRATIIPLDHPNPNGIVFNGEVAHTSRVLSYDKATGEFETMNTRYVLDTESVAK